MTNKIDKKEPSEKRPTCAVHGMIRPNAVCSQVIVGGDFCGYKGGCPHKVERETNK